MRKIDAIKITGNFPGRSQYVGCGRMRILLFRRLIAIAKADLGSKLANLSLFAS